jgi:hypothetical protein
LLVQDHPRWKYLVSADGVVAATRLDKLLLMNSVVCKEQSPFEAHYYRCVLRQGRGMCVRFCQPLVGGVVPARCTAGGAM